jgi:hypothetical protein
MNLCLVRAGVARATAAVVIDVVSAGTRASHMPNSPIFCIADESASRPHVRLEQGQCRRGVCSEHPNSSRIHGPRGVDDGGGDGTVRRVCACACVCVCVCARVCVYAWARARARARVSVCV